MSEDEREIRRRNLERAKQMRSAPTPTESTLWYHLRAGRMGYKFRRQHPVGPYIVDFYCSDCQLIVEVDGDAHVAQVGYDNARTAWLQQQGYKVLRFTNVDVRFNLSDVLKVIHSECEQRVGLRLQHKINHEH